MLPQDARHTLLPALEEAFTYILVNYLPPFKREEEIQLLGSSAMLRTGRKK